MIKIISTALQLALPLVNFFFSRSQRKNEMKDNLFKIAKRYDAQVLKNAKLRREYQDLKKELLKQKRGDV